MERIKGRYRGWLVAFRFRCILLLLGLLLSGCAKYTSKPLVPQEIYQQSQHSSLDDLIAAQGNSELEVRSIIDLSDGLNEDEVAYAALFLNPALKAKRIEKGIAAGQLIDANLWPNPELGSNFRWEKNGRGRSFEPELAFEVLRWGERKGKRLAAKANVEAVRFEVAAEEWNTVANARAAYWEAVALREKLRISNEALSIAEGLEKSVQSRVMRGVATAMSQKLSEVESVRLRLETKRVEGELQSAERTLRLAIGLPPGAELKIQSAENPLARVKRTWTYEEVANGLVGTAPLKASEWHYQVSEGNLRAAIARQYPSLQLGPSNSIDFDGQWTAFLGFLVSLDLPILNQNKGEIREMLAAREMARANYLARLHEQRGLLAEAFGQLETSESQLDYQEKELLPKIQETLRLTERAFEAGELDIFELFKAQASIIETKQGYLEALVAYRRALQEVERVLGKPLGSISRSNQSTEQKPANQAPEGER